MNQPATISADYTLRPSDVAATLALLVEARQPAMLWGGPGTAKSMIAQQVAAAGNRQYVDVRALLLDPVDLRGIPWRDSDGRTRWAPPVFLPPTDDAGLVLNAMEAEGSLPVYPAAAIRLLMLTGCRRNEIVALEWKNVDLEGGELRLPDSKTGPRMVPLSPAAARVLRELPRIEGNPWVIPGFKPGKHLADLNHYWDRVRDKAKLDDVRIHDLRHSFASRALALGESLSMIGKLLGHNKIDTTSRYAHLARDSIKASSARIADSIGADILDRRPIEPEPA